MMPIPPGNEAQVWRLGQLLALVFLAGFILGIAAHAGALS
jgi:uncharacterized membrane protein YciS (DUF1049 family)